MKVSDLIRDLVENHSPNDDVAVDIYSHHDMIDLAEDVLPDRKVTIALARRAVRLLDERMRKCGSIDADTAERCLRKAIFDSDVKKRGK